MDAVDIFLLSSDSFALHLLRLGPSDLARVWLPRLEFLVLDLQPDLSMERRSSGQVVQPAD